MNICVLFLFLIIFFGIKKHSSVKGVEMEEKTISLQCKNSTINDLEKKTAFF